MFERLSEFWDKYLAGPKPLDVAALLKGAPCELPPGTTWEPIWERLKIVELKPGDTLVIECAAKLSDRGYTNVVESIKKYGHKAMLLEEGLTLRAVLRDTPEVKK